MPKKTAKKTIIPEDKVVSNIITDKFICDFVGKRAENIHNSPSLTKTAKADRDYLMGMFALIYNTYKDKVDGIEVNGNRRYSPKEMFEAAAKYIQVTIEHGQPLTISGMGIFLGMRRKELFNFLNERKFLPGEEFIFDFCDFIESYNEYAAHKKQNPAGPIFILKNFGWKDKFEIEASSTAGALTEEERELAQKRIKNFSE